MQINFIPSLDTREICTMHSKSDNVETMMGIESFLRRYQEGLEAKMREGSNFVFESVILLYYSLHKTSLNSGGSYTDCPSWLKNKRATINPKSKDNKCFRDAAVTSLNHEKIRNNLERISNFEPFFHQYNSKGTEFPSH